jgi:Putative motility protein
MDIGNISSVASAASDMSQAKTGDAVALAVLKKAMDIEAQGAAALIQALPQPASNNPPNLGKHVDAFA